METVNPNVVSEVFVALSVLNLLIPPILIAFNQALKAAGMDSKYAVLVNIFGGTFMGILIGLYTVTPLVISIVAGLLVGAAASGLYQIGKFAIKGEV